MKFLVSLLLYTTLNFSVTAFPETADPGFEIRMKKYVDSLHVVDTHEHLFTPEIVNGSNFPDLMLLFQQNGYDDLISAHMPRSLFDSLYNEPLTPSQKWKLIEPFCLNAFNTSYMKVLQYGVKMLYGVDGLNEQTAAHVSDEIKKTYSTSRFDLILKDSCKIDFVIQDGYYMEGKDEYFRYAKKFDHWINVRSNYSIDSLAIAQVDPIYSLEDYERSLREAFEAGVRNGMTVVKISLAYSRTLQFEKVPVEAARKVFRKLVNGNEDLVIPFSEAKPFQDYILYRLLELADKYDLPVAIHTGMQAGHGNILSHSDPLLLTNLFMDFPDVKFVLFHGSYPFGGELAVLAKTFRNVYIDMNWMYSISPSYSERYLNEWLETVPVNKLMAFGGDCMAIENVYSELHIARSLIAKVLIGKVSEGYFTEKEAKTVARMILHDNAIDFYKLTR
ncbi:MAG TPA: amidohydrolase family protein [Bacteroidales bacterium]|nr:amidohydrolase family protein [Bacteroidales bacterium]